MSSLSLTVSKLQAEDTAYNGVVSTGAADELQRATELARHTG